MSISAIITFFLMAGVAYASYRFGYKNGWADAMDNPTELNGGGVSPDRDATDKK